MIKNKEFDYLSTLIRENNIIVIFRHKNPDGDALGSQFGLKEWIKLNYPNKKVYAAGECRENDFNGLFPNHDTIPLKDIKKALGIVLDTSSDNRIANDYFLDCKQAIYIDHHPKAQEHGIFLRDETACSTCEIIANFILQRPYCLKNRNIAKYLYSGMITDTGSFTYNNVGAKALRMASFITNKYENLNQEIYSKLNQQSENSLRFQGYVLSNFKIFEDVGYILLDKGIEKEFGLEYNQIIFQANLILKASNVKVVAYGTYDIKNDWIKVSIRSKEIPINDIATKYKGGGHPLASGCYCSTHDNFNNLVKDLAKLIS